jgi:hypothetical protein
MGKKEKTSFSLPMDFGQIKNAYFIEKRRVKVVLNKR